MSLTKSPSMTILKNLRSKIFKSRYSGWDKGRKLRSPFVKYTMWPKFGHIVFSTEVGLRGTTLDCMIWSLVDTH